MFIKFGIDGWCDIIVEDFIFENVWMVVWVYVQVLWLLGVCLVVVGFDICFQGQVFVRVVVEVMVVQGFDVWLVQDYLLMFVLLFVVVYYGVGGGVMIIVLYNLLQYSGYKIKGSYGGSVILVVVVQVEVVLVMVESYDGLCGEIRFFDIWQVYYEQFDWQFDLEILCEY